MNTWVKYTFIVKVTLMVWALPIFAYALPSDASQPIRLSADKATYSERLGVTTYSGNVIISQGTLKITASNITVNLNTDKSIGSAVATGSPATFEQVVSEQKGLPKASPKRLIIMLKQGL